MPALDASLKGLQIAQHAQVVERSFHEYVDPHIWLMRINLSRELETYCVRTVEVEYGGVPVYTSS